MTELHGFGDAAETELQLAHAAADLLGATLATSGPLVGGGEMGARMRAVDWAATPLGALDQWPQSLRTTVSTFLNSRFPILVWWGRDLVMLYNEAYAPLIGTKHPQALGAAGRTVFPEIWEIIGPMLGGVLARGEATWSEDQLLLLHRHGYAEECYFTFSYSPIRDESGGVGGVFTAVTETTERVIGERRLATLRALAERPAAARTVEEAVRSAIDVLESDSADIAFAALYLTDADGRVARLAGTANVPADVACPAMVSLDEGAATGPATAPTAWPIADVVRSGAPRLVELPPARVPSADPSGAPRPGHALVLPVASAGQDRPRGVLVTGISPRRVLDDTYHGFLALAAGQVASALANAEAYEIERRRAEALAELDRAKTAFFSNVSHEFRTPLTLMLGPVEDALTEPSVTDANRTRLEIIHRSALRLQRLVNTLLDFSRIEAGRIAAEFRPTDVAAYTTELASTFRSAVERAGLTFVVDCPPLAEPVHVDRDMWEKIVLNLMSNAFKHTFDGTIAVTTRTTGDSFELAVRDTGVGIPADQLARIFERFHRVPSTRSRSHEGTGIGLALVQELVRLHGGTIEVESNVGVGTTFTVRVPLGTAHLADAHVAEAGESHALDAVAAPYVAEALRWLPERADERAPAGDSVTSPAVAAAVEATRGARVLLADDNADMRGYVGRLLREQGWTVEMVSDGRAALEAARARRPDLVLSDVMMPELDGFALLRMLRDDPATRGVPVVLLSARAGEASRIEGLGAGADDYLEKPFSARELVARVAGHLGLSRARARAAAEVEVAHAELTEAHARLQEQASATTEALAALRMEKSRLAELFRQAPAFICVLRGPQHVFEMANDAYAQLVGFRPLIGWPLREALPEAEGQGFVDLLDGVLATGEPFVGREIPVELQREPSGATEKRFLTFVYQAITEADGSRSGVIALGMDVTDQVRARAEVERARADAEAARRFAEEANLAKSQFLAAMSHELRTPLNAIAGYAELLDAGLYGPISERQREPLERVRRSQQHLLSLINDVLNFAKLEAGRVEYETEELPLADVVAQVVPMIEPQLVARQLAYDVRVDPRLVVRADREKTQQILLNLLSNAVKFTPPGGHVALESVHRDGAPRGMVLLRVSDTGIGIPREKQDGIFDPFVQVQRNLTRSIEGTGLGLAISRDLARGMGGELRVRSQVGVGSAFTLALPAA